MPRYEVHWLRTTRYYGNEEIEAPSEEEAREIALAEGADNYGENTITHHFEIQAVEKAAEEDLNNLAVLKRLEEQAVMIAKLQEEIALLKEAYRKGDERLEILANFIYVEKVTEERLNKLAD